MAGQVNIGGVWKNINGVYVNIGGAWKPASSMKCNIGGVWKDGWSAGGGIDSYTKLMLHMNGINGSTTFTDSSLSPKTVTANGNAQISTVQSKFGGASGYFDGSNDYLTLDDSDDWSFGTGNFTIDCWVRFNTLPIVGSASAIYSHFHNGANCNVLQLYNNSGTYEWQLKAISAGTEVISVKKPTTVSIDTWYHIAAVRSGNNFKIFQNGSQVGTDVTNSNAMVDVTNKVYIGSWGSGSYFLNGYLDEFRISKDIARWTSNFTPPTSEYTT